jgi:cytochrome c553
MSDDTKSKAPEAERPSHFVLPTKASEQRPAASAQPDGRWPGRILSELLAGLFLAAVTISIGFADVTTDRISLPVEILGANGAAASRTFTLQVDQAESVRSLWLQIHGVRYADQASVQVNTNAWIPLNNNTVTIAEPGRSLGGIGGAVATLVVTLPLPAGTVVSGTNSIRFRFNRSDGVVSSYRVLAWNFLTMDGRKILPPEDFVEDAPETWTAPLPDAASIQAGRELWQSAALAASSLPNSPRIQAHCADCHARDGRDLKYFNFSNGSIVARAQFHGLSELQGEQIASYIRSLPLPNPGRPWNPPYQPGPGLDEQPISNWAAGAGLAWVLERDTDALPYLLPRHGTQTSRAAANPPGKAANLGELVGQINPDMFRPDGTLNAREIPIALQLPDWSQWLPRVHPKDAWGSAFSQSAFAAWYGETTPNRKGQTGTKPSLRALLAGAQPADRDIRPVLATFAQWSQARRAFLKRFVKARTVWSPTLSNKVYSTQLWQLVKTWEIMQEFGLEGRGRDLFGPAADSRTWCSTVPAETAPSAAHIPDGPAGIGGSGLTNEYFTASWYELQIVLNSGNHQHRDRGPVDWVYLIGRFQDLYVETHQPEPTRLLVAVIKALQSTNPHLGPDDLRQGWRPDENIDPRIMISPAWAPIFKPLPTELHQALTASLLAAWMDKNLQYPIAQYLPLGLPPQDYTARRPYNNITGGKVWEAAQQFRDAKVSSELVRRLEQWGMQFTDRAARLQYH